METLPQDVMENIFYWLPAKAVGRSRCVSKPWRFILSQPEFIRNHLKRTKTCPRDEESLILFCEYRDTLYTSQLNNAHMSGELTIDAKHLIDFDLQYLSSMEINRIISCDGLVFIDNDEGVLLNPTTRELKKLPSPPDELGLFDVLGLGYDSVSDDYKILAVNFNRQHKNNERFVIVYSVRNGTWKKVECSPSMLNFGDNVFSYETINGCIHSVAKVTVDSPYIIETFDFATERFGEVLPPSSLDIWNFGDTHRVAILNGCVCLFREKSENYESDVWMMKEYGVQDSWTKFTIIDSGETELKLLCMVGKDQLLMLKGKHWDDQKLAIYNLEEQSFRDIDTDEYYVGALFIESLVSPHCGTSAVQE